MFRWRFTTDAQPRTKNGQPPHSTTGVASASCDPVQRTPCGTQCCSGWPGRISDDHEREDRQRSARATTRTAASCRRARGCLSSSVTVTRLERHAADRAAPGPSLHDLRMHRAGVPAGRRRAARRRAARRGRGRGRVPREARRRRGVSGRRIGLELGLTRPAAEVVRRALVLVAAGGPGRIDLHATDGVGHRAPGVTHVGIRARRAPAAPARDAGDRGPGPPAAPSKAASVPCRRTGWR